MSGLIKRIFPIFLAATLFVTIIMLCCIRNSDNKIEMSPNTVAVNTSITESGSISSKKHVFHEGEMRGVWVPYFSLSNGNTSMSEEEFKKHFDEIVKTAKESGMNTLFVHVRSHCDAVYPSELFPYSDIFTGSGDTSPDYDPLEYMISAAHKAGLEFHAWINPYRVLSDSTEDMLCESSPCYKWLHDSDTDNDRNIIEYNGGLYLNPSKPEARSLIINGVRELVNKYDVDGIHLDDYFYMFTEGEYDEVDYNEYSHSVSESTTPLTLMQWRCANVNVLISGIYSVIKNIDEKTLFGISPQGNMENDMNMGADIYSWCSKYGYIDYIAPQIYYNSENSLLPYEETVESWKSIITNTDIDLYIGLALYKAGGDEDEGTWQNSDDIIKGQIEYARQTNAEGFILYSWEYLRNEQTVQEVANMEELLEET